MPKLNKMPKFYRVKVWFKGNKKEVRFAKPETYDKDWDKHWKEGNILMADAVTGEQFLVPNRDNLMLEDQPFSFGKDDPETHMPIDTEYDRYINDAYKEALKAHKKLGKGIKVGKLCFVGVADGYASYVITKVNAKTCKVQWRAFAGGDDYVDQRWGYERTVPHDEANMYMREDDGIFGCV